MARTLTAEHEIKEKWREEIRAEIVGKHSEEIACWEKLHSDLKVLLAAKNSELYDLRTRLAEIESQLKSVDTASPQ